MERKWILVENKSNKVVPWLLALLGQESVMHDNDKIIVFSFGFNKTEIIDMVNRETNKTDADLKYQFIDVVKFNDISNLLQKMDNMIVLLDIELNSIQRRDDFYEDSPQKKFWLNCIQNKTKKNLICITSKASNPIEIMNNCGKPDRMKQIGTVYGTLNSPSEIEADKIRAKAALQQADKFWHSLSGPNILLSALEEAQNITNGKPAHPKSWPPEFEKEGNFPFNVNLLKHNDDNDSINQALQAFKALFEYHDQKGKDLCEKSTVLGGVWRCKGCRPLTVKHITDVLLKAGIQCTCEADVAMTQEINLPMMPGVVFLFCLAIFLLEGLDEWNGQVTLGVNDNGNYLHPYFILPIPNNCYHEFIASYNVRRDHQGAGVLAFEDLLCCRLSKSSDGINGGNIKYMNQLDDHCSKRGPRLVPLICHEFRDKEIYISWVSKKFEKQD